MTARLHATRQHENPRSAVGPNGCLSSRRMAIV